MQGGPLDQDRAVHAWVLHPDLVPPRPSHPGAVLGTWALPQLPDQPQPPPARAQRTVEVRVVVLVLVAHRLLRFLIIVVLRGEQLKAAGARQAQRTRQSLEAGVRPRAARGQRRF